jgi:hypothetical protein
MWILLHADNLRIMGQSSESPERNWEANRMPAEFLQRGIEVGEWGEHLLQHTTQHMTTNTIPFTLRDHIKPADVTVHSLGAQRSERLIEMN